MARVRKKLRARWPTYDHNGELICAAGTIVDLIRLIYPEDCNCYPDGDCCPPDALVRLPDGSELRLDANDLELHSIIV